MNEKELDILYNLDLVENKRLDRIRDLFLVGAWTGCRFSDFSTIGPDQITNGFLYVQQAKTGAKVVIPLHPVVKAILQKYNGILPDAPSNQKFNDYIKEVGELAGINTPTAKRLTRGGKRITQSFPKWELISSHTARRSFATNLYKSGFPSISIMQITGHTTEKAFLKYIKVTPEEHAHLLAEHWKKFNKTLSED
ncbi:site-specific integrase [Gaoshiqia sp. Z1-71]|uniref:site-specific integrase n=1 Tax=Gaoshiqia hydrogeniformans TaxID=3290090 RepID=UPI003BF82901